MHTKTRSKRVLLLDDEYMTCRWLARALEAQSFEVVGPFTNVADAIMEIEETLPDVAILDVNLGGGSTSFAFASRLRDLNIPFAFLTGYSEIVSMEKSLLDASVLTKPCSIRAVIAEVETMLAAQGAEDLVVAKHGNVSM